MSIYDEEPERYYEWMIWKLRKEREKKMKNGKLDYHQDMQDMVNHPPHYNQAGIEALDAILACPQMRAVNIIYKVI